MANWAMVRAVLDDYDQHYSEMSVQVCMLRAHEAEAILANVLARKI